ncbi:MAG: hypothetical protein IKQ18_08835 [Clostridia bacterium]|jgi:hypothetical protein|nr:hypothetical protein [Clostridia bacterium]
MYAQQYRQPPKDYGGVSIKEPPRRQPEAEVPEIKKSPSPLFSVGGEEILIAVIIFIVMSGGWEKNALVLIALVFILI